MYPMKIQFWTGCLLASLVCLPSAFVNQTKVLAVESVAEMAQKSSAYQEYMLSGYKLTTRYKNYEKALEYFQKALAVRPGDRYATAAIRNLKIYIARGSKFKTSYVQDGPSKTLPTGTRATVNTFFPLTYVQVTAQEHPIVLFHIPESGDKIKELKFVLWEGDAKTSKTLYETTFRPVGKKGIVSVSIPRYKAPLETGKEYTWTCFLRYPLENDASHEKVTGKIQRVQDETIDDQTITNWKWYDDLSMVANLRRQNPNDPDLQQEWTNLLKLVKLEAIANEPLL
jgi:tetratricopeptide (TPR) repeat protein